MHRLATRARTLAHRVTHPINTPLAVGVQQHPRFNTTHAAAQSASAARDFIVRASRRSPLLATAAAAVIMSSLAGAAVMHAEPAGHSAAPAASAAAAASAWVAPPPTLWSRMRSVWIPTSPQELYEAEKATFAGITFPYQSRLIDVPSHPLLKEKQPWQINTLSITNPELAAKQQASGKTEAPLVLLHGFGAGIGLWMSNYNLFGANYAETHAIDMLGWGRSTRADLDLLLERQIKDLKLKKGKTPAEHAAYKAAVATLAEDFTVDALEAWREAMGLEQMVLCGHSMGGYLSAAYALKYPQRVATLVLASPVGVPHAREMSREHWSRTARTLITLGRSLWWGAGYTPQSLVRGLGRLGPKPVTGYVTNRFASSEEELERRDRAGPPPQGEGKANNKRSQAPTATAASAQVADRAEGAEAAQEAHQNEGPAAPALEVDDALHAARKLAASVSAANAASDVPVFDKNVIASYLYHICAAAGSGEYAFRHLFNEDGFAFKPLMASLPAWAAANAQAPHGPVPLVLLYGTHDWMDANAGAVLAETLSQQGHPARCAKVSKAGHQLFIDNPKDFQNKLKQAVKFGQQTSNRHREQAQQAAAAAGTGDAQLLPHAVWIQD